MQLSLKEFLDQNPDIDYRKTKSIFKNICNGSKSVVFNFCVNMFRDSTRAGVTTTKSLLTVGLSGNNDLQANLNYGYSIIISKFGGYLTDSGSSICIGSGELYKFRKLVMDSTQLLLTVPFNYNNKRLKVNEESISMYISGHRFKFTTAAITKFNKNQQDSKGIKVSIDDVHVTDLTEWALGELYEFTRTDLHNYAINVTNLYMSQAMNIAQVSFSRNIQQHTEEQMRKKIEQMTEEEFRAMKEAVKNTPENEVNNPLYVSKNVIEMPGLNNKGEPISKLNGNRDLNINGRSIHDL